jgi:hypothetical protein
VHDNQSLTQLLNVPTCEGVFLDRDAQDSTNHHHRLKLAEALDELWRYGGLWKNRKQKSFHSAD